MVEQLELFELPVIEKPFKELSFRPLNRPIWTENKARLIERYLYYFIFITHHGSYIDGFAGPQEPDNPEMWSAKLVLESEPMRLRKFFLCELDKKKFQALEGLKENQPVVRGRSIDLYQGDFNQNVSKILESGQIKEKDATFCLLDQRTFECRWSTLEALASYPKDKYKIELFYFLAAGWLHRALSAQADKSVIDEWWGGSDWDHLQKTQVARVYEPFCERIKSKLGYKHVVPWPIYERKDGGKIMYYMIHATDHDAAPALMDRAYRQAVTAKETKEQFKMEFDEWKKDYEN